MSALVEVDDLDVWLIEITRSWIKKITLFCKAYKVWSIGFNIKGQEMQMFK